jgi:hypothetical protein
MRSLSFGYRRVLAKGPALAALQGASAVKRQTPFRAKGREDGADREAYPTRVDAIRAMTDDLRFCLSPHRIDHRQSREHSNASTKNVRDAQGAARSARTARPLCTMTTRTGEQRCDP